MARPNELIPAFCDFETFWDVKYTLKSMSTTDYVHDPRFAIHGASCAIADQEPRWLVGTELYEWLRDNRDRLFVGHHTLFDGYIVRHAYGWTFEHYFCTMGMIEALFQGAVGRGLDEAMTTLLGWESGKTDILTRTKGKYWDQFTPDEQHEMGFYANQDLKATQELFYKFGPSLPHSEWLTMSNMLKMFCRPLLEFDEKILERALVTAINEREEEIETAIKIFDCTEDDLRGVNSFEELLARCEYPMPMKPSPSKPDKMIPALAKTDQGFQDMLESDDPRVKALAEARRAVKSTQGITRAQRFKDLHETVGYLPAAYNYYRAHTGRPTGANKINVANIKRGSDLRKSIVAPPGYRLAVCDSSQIECRSDGYLAGQEDLMDLFRERRDPYNDMATEIFGRTIDRKYQDEHGEYPDFLEGFIGKTALLGLGYQMGGPKFKLTVETNAKVQLGLNYEIDLDEAYRIVDIYRRKNWRIVKFWDAAQEALHRMVANDQPYQIEYADDYLEVDPAGNKIWFPNGTYLFYPCLELNEGNFTYVTRLGKNYINKYIYGGKLVENIVQKFARDIVVWQMDHIADGYPVVLHTYDENVAVVPERQADEAFDWMLHVMRTAPAWAHSLPLDAEGGVAKEYSK